MRNDVGYDGFKCVTGSGILHSGFKAWLSSLASSGVLRTSGASRGGRERSGLTGVVSGSFKKYFSGFSTFYNQVVLFLSSETKHIPNQNFAN